MVLEHYGQKILVEAFLECVMTPKCIISYHNESTEKQKCATPTHID
jgi:hypothetical protein